MFSPKEKHVCLHVPTAAQPHLKGVRVCTTCTSVCAATISLIHPLWLSVCLSVHVCPCVLMLVSTMLRCYECATSIWCRSNSCHIHLIRHTRTHSTLALKYSTLYTGTWHTHSLQRWKQVIFIFTCLYLCFYRETLSDTHLSLSQHFNTCISRYI